jgi:hypothetical protein
MRTWHARWREAVAQIEKTAARKPVYHDKMPERLTPRLSRGGHAAVASAAFGSAIVFLISPDVLTPALQ